MTKAVAPRARTKNQDLWQRLLRAIGDHEIEWRWVRGHTGVPENERCDQLAMAAAMGADRLVDEGFARG